LPGGCGNDLFQRITPLSIYIKLYTLVSMSRWQEASPHLNVIVGIAPTSDICLLAVEGVNYVIFNAGVCLTLWRPVAGGWDGWSNAGNWISLFSAALLGLRLVISANALKNIDPVRMSIWQMAISLPCYAVAGWTFETIQWHALGAPAILGLMYQGVIVAAVGFVVSFWLMQNFKPSIMMSFNFVSPVVGVLLAGWLLDESVAPTIWMGVALVVSGLILISWNRSSAARAG